MELEQDYSIRYAVPFSRLDSTIPLPDKRPFPKELKTIGDHIKYARLQRGMLIKDVIVQLKINRETLRGWELNLYEPFVRHYPNIIRFLGYWPFMVDVTTLGGRIKKYRYQYGLSQDQFGVLVDTDRCQVSLWENNKQRPVPKTLKAIEKILTKTR